MSEQIPTLKGYNCVRGFHVRRGDTWLLTLEQWQTLWRDGDYSKRGTGADRWSLKRCDPTGPFSADNCYVELQPRKNRARTEIQRTPLPVDGGRIVSVNGVRTLTVKQWIAERRAELGQ